MLDKLIIEVDKAMRNLFAEPVSKRVHPDHDLTNVDLSEREKKHACGLMRVNHCGEICAQGLYQGQALTARDKSNQDALTKASFEETEHLAWTKQRVVELGGQTSILNPFFYVASLAVGTFAGICGDKWSLGFVEETEKQVGAHLKSHLQELPENDVKSTAIVKQMQIDEAKHATMAHDFGANELPPLIKSLMHVSSKVMTKTVYYI